ncbi:MAG: hypothetical protein Q8P62_04995 [Candidatus Peregrinibacteria bacterium]|nr:hypothetical protein [Candidatus Peregrinibacteria bacterium]
MNNTITTDGRQNMAVISPIWQNPAPVSRPCGREEMASVSDKNLHLSKIAAPAYKNLHSSKTASLSDENLYALCKTYGERARIWRQRFAGLLPEVFKRKLYEKKGFHSIFEFSKKLAGMSEEQVRLVLNLEKRFETMPALRSLLTTGKVSVNKLSRIVSIAKPGNEMFLATQVQILSKNAVETLVRDEKFATGNYSKNETKNMNFANRNSDSENSENFGNIIMNFEYQDGLQKSFFDSKIVPGQMCFDTKNTKSNSDKNTLNLSHEVQEKLLELQEKGIDINELLKEFLQKREQEIAQKKEEISQKILEREEEKPVTRHIPASVKRILYSEHGTKCSMKNCQKPSEQIHHTQRFSASRSHDPRYLAPLCKDHHEIAHNADITYCEIRQRIK